MVMPPCSSSQQPHSTAPMISANVARITTAMLHAASRPLLFLRASMVLSAAARIAAASLSAFSFARSSPCWFMTSACFWSATRTAVIWSGVSAPCCSTCVMPSVPAPCCRPSALSRAVTAVPASGPPSIVARVGASVVIAVLILKPMVAPLEALDPRPHVVRGGFGQRLDLGRQVGEIAFERRRLRLDLLRFMFRVGAQLRGLGTQDGDFFADEVFDCHDDVLPVGGSVVERCVVEVRRHAVGPASAELRPQAQAGVIAQPLRVEAQQHVVGLHTRQPGRAHGAPVAVVGDADGGLQLVHGDGQAAVHGEVEHLVFDGGQRIVQHVPEVALVDILRAVARQVLDVDMRIGALRNAPVGLAAGVKRVVDVAALVADQAVKSDVEIERHGQSFSGSRGRSRRSTFASTLLSRRRMPSFISLPRSWIASKMFPTISFMSVLHMYCVGSSTRKSFTARIKSRAIASVCLIRSNMTLNNHPPRKEARNVIMAMEI